MGIRRGSISTPIIADGLVFNMDAANRASYIPDATTSFNTINLNESGSFVNDPTYISPPTSASCWDFDGTDDYINCGASTLSGETALTISSWVYPISYGGAAAESIISTEQSSPNRGFYLALYNGQNFRWQVSTNGSAKDSLDTVSSTVTLNAWQHVLAVWTQTTMSLYINGVLSKTQSTSNATGTFTTTNNLLLGARLSSAGFFEGNIANTQIYTRALSSNEVLHNYNALKSRFE